MKKHRSPIVPASSPRGRWLRVLLVLGLVAAATIGLWLRANPVKAGNSDAPLSSFKSYGACTDDFATHVVIAGVGMQGQTDGVISINVPGPVVDAFLYWNGTTDSSASPGDPFVTLSGVSLIGDTIGGPAEWPLGITSNFSYAHIADVGPNGANIIAQGAADYALGGMDAFNVWNNGAALVVIYRETGAATSAAIHHGLDLAKGHGQPVSGPGTKPVVFAFDPAPVARQAVISSVVGGVVPPAGNALWITTGEGTPPVSPPDIYETTLVADQPLVAADGPFFDTYDATVTIPANATYAIVQVESKSISGAELEWIVQTFELQRACDGQPTSTPTSTPSQTPTATATATGTATPTSTATATSTPTATPTATPSPTATPTEEGTPTPTSTPGGPTDTPTATPTETATVTPTATPTETPTTTPTETATPTVTATATASPTASPTATATPSATPTETPTRFPTTTPTATPEAVCQDQYEPDNLAAQAKEITTDGTAQRRTFDPVGDQDWISFNAVRGQVYTITTFNLVLDTDTVLRLYDTDGSTLIDANDDCPGSSQIFASCITWTAPQDGRYYVMVKDFYNRGDCLGYDINITSESNLFLHYIPVVERGLPSATPTRTPTRVPTATPTRVPSPTPSVTFTATPTATRTATPTPSRTAIATPTPTRTATGTPTRTPTPTSTRVATATPTRVPTQTPTPKPTVTVIPGRVIVPGLDHPKGIAANPRTNRIYVASRENDRLFVLDGGSNDVIAQIQTGDEPFGVAVNPNTNKVYVASFRDGQLTVVDGATNLVTKLLYLGPELTYVDVNTLTNRVYVVSHQMNSLFIVDGNTDLVWRVVSSGGGGAFGLAVNENLDRVYVSNRDTQSVVTFDGAGNELPGQRIKPAAAQGVPFAMGFNPNTSKLYLMVGPSDVVDRAEVYRASASGLAYLASVIVDTGGRDAGGGVAVNTTTNRVFVTNARANTVGVIDGITDMLLALVPVGTDPFGIAANPATNTIYIGNRASDDLYVIHDDFMRR